MSLLEKWWQSVMQRLNITCTGNSILEKKQLRLQCTHSEIFAIPKLSCITLSVTGRNLQFYPTCKLKCQSTTFSWMIVEGKRLWMRIKGIYYSWHRREQTLHFHVNTPFSQVPKVICSGSDGCYTCTRNHGLKFLQWALTLPELCPTGRHYLCLPRQFAIQTSFITYSVPFLCLQDRQKWQASKENCLSTLTPLNILLPSGLLSCW